MNFRTITLVLVLGLGLSTQVNAQKIGYANVEAILMLMPETKTMNQSLQSFEKKLTEDLQNTQGYLRTLYAEYQEMAESGTASDTDLQAKEKEIIDLEQKLQEKQLDSQQKLMTKRQDMLEPIVNKIQKEIDALAEAEGYTYIFNTVDGSGVSILLKGPEEHNLTQKLMSRLGIQIPENN